MKSNYEMRLVDVDGTVYAVANTILGLVRYYNKQHNQKLTIADVLNEKYFYEYGNFDEEGRDAVTGLR